MVKSLLQLRFFSIYLLNAVVDEILLHFANFVSNVDVIVQVVEAIVKNLWEYDDGENIFRKERKVSEPEREDNIRDVCIYELKEDHFGKQTVFVVMPHLIVLVVSEPARHWFEQFIEYRDVKRVGQRRDKRGEVRNSSLVFKVGFIGNPCVNHAVNSHPHEQCRDRQSHEDESQVRVWVGSPPYGMSGRIDVQVGSELRSF